MLSRMREGPCQSSQPWNTYMLYKEEKRKWSRSIGFFPYEVWLLIRHICPGSFIPSFRTLTCNKRSTRGKLTRHLRKSPQLWISLILSNMANSTPKDLALSHTLESIIKTLSFYQSSLSNAMKPILELLTPGLPSLVGFLFIITGLSKEKTKILCTFKIFDYWLQSWVCKSMKLLLERDETHWI